MRYVINILLWIPLVWLLIGPSSATTTGENRALSTFPERPTSITEIKPFFANFAVYFDDHFIGRSQLIKTINSAKYALGVNPSKVNILGKEDWIYNNYDSLVDQHKQRYVLNDTQAKRFANSIKVSESYFTERGISFLFALAPDKASIYPEYLPERMKIQKNLNYTKVLKAIREADIATVNLKTGLLRAKRKTGEQLYYKGDSHWNKAGAFYGYLELMQKIKKWFPDIYILRKDNLYNKHFTLVKPLMKNLSLWNPPSEKIVEFYPKGKVISDVKNIVKSKVNVFQVQKHINENDGPKLLLIRDSFTDNLMPFYKRSFSEIYVVHHRWGNWDTSYLKTFTPDLVIYEMVERYGGNKPLRPKF